MIRLAIAAAAGVALTLSVMELADRADGGLVLHDDPADVAESLAAAGRWAEAAALSEFAMTRPDLGDAQKAAEVSRLAGAELDGVVAQIERFAHGAMTGEPTDMASMLGSLSLDLFVVGDVRDLAVQGWKTATDGSGDSVVIALSAIGLMTTLAPQLDWAPALLKSLKRTGALSRRFVQHLSRGASRALATGDYGALAAVLKNFGQAAERLGPGLLRGVMPYVDDADDLARVARSAAADARGTYVLARLFGKGGVKAIDDAGGNAGALLASVKAGSRGTKLVKKSIGSLPTTWLALVAIASFAALAAAAASGSRRRAGNRRSAVESAGATPPDGGPDPSYRASGRST